MCRTTSGISTKVRERIYNVSITENGALRRYSHKMWFLRANVVELSHQVHREEGTRLLLTSRPAEEEEMRPLEEAEQRVNDLSVCKGHGSKGTGMIGSGKTPLTPWQSLPQVICSLPLSFLPVLVFLFSLALVLSLHSLSWGPLPYLCLSQCLFL